MADHLKLKSQAPFFLFALHLATELLFFWIIAIGQYRDVEERTDGVANATVCELLFRVVDWLCVLHWLGLLGKWSWILWLWSVCQVLILVWVFKPINDSVCCVIFAHT